MTDVEVTPRVEAGLPPLMTAEDVEARLGRPLTPAEAARIDALLADASSAIRSYTRQTISAVADDAVRLQVRRTHVRLPQRPVTALDAVSDPNGNPCLYRWNGFDIIHVAGNVIDTFAWVPWVTGMPYVDVVYDHGYDPIPDDIVGVGCSMVSRALGRDPIDAGITSETIAGYSYSIGSAAAAGGFGMLPTEREVLDAYRRVGGWVDQLPEAIW